MPISPDAYSSIEDGDLHEHVRESLRQIPKQVIDLLNFWIMFG